MYSSLQLGPKYLNFLLTAFSPKGHGVHSPYVYDFVTSVLRNHHSFEAYQPIENLRKTLLTNRQTVEVLDYGAGPSQGLPKKRSIASIARSASKSAKWGQLLFRLVHHYRPKTILELGTSLGISTAYLASAQSTAHVTTVEGSPAIATLAAENLHSLSLNNVDQVVGNFDDVLPALVKQLAPIDMAFIDGNHRRQPLLSYFNQLRPAMALPSLVILDDIRWNKEMEGVWDEIKSDTTITLTVDLFMCGLVFFNSNFLTKQHFDIRF